MPRTSTWRDERRVLAAFKRTTCAVKGSQIIRDAAVPGAHANAVLRHLYLEKRIRPVTPQALSSHKAQFQSVEWELTDAY